MLTKKIWDYVIEIKKGFVLRKRKIYSLSRKEREKMCKFIKEQDKKRIVQDYRYLNKQTIKNNCLLPFISEIVENISTKKVSTKLNLWWWYNNVYIKKRDK